MYGESGRRPAVSYGSLSTAGPAAPRVLQMHPCDAGAARQLMARPADPFQRRRRGRGLSAYQIIYEMSRMMAVAAANEASTAPYKFSVYHVAAFSLLL